jgi:hypothetical protein
MIVTAVTTGNQGCQGKDTTTLWNKIQHFALQISHKWQGLNFLTLSTNRKWVKQKKSIISGVQKICR